MDGYCANATVKKKNSWWEFDLGVFINSVCVCVCVLMGSAHSISLSISDQKTTFCCHGALCVSEVLKLILACVDASPFMFQVS